MLKLHYLYKIYFSNGHRTPSRTLRNSGDLKDGGGGGRDGGALDEGDVVLQVHGRIVVVTLNKKFRN